MERKIFKIEIEEILQKVYDIEATSVEEAINIAEEKYHNEEYVLDYNSLQETNFREFKDNLVKDSVSHIHNQREAR